MGGGAAFIGGNLEAGEARGSSSDLLGLPSVSSIIHSPRPPRQFGAARSGWWW